MHIIILIHAWSRIIYSQIMWSPKLVYFDISAIFQLFVDGSIFVLASLYLHANEC